MSEHYCSATIYGPRVQHWRCPRAGVVLRDGKWFCRQHDPSNVKARRIKAAAAREAEREADEAVRAEGAELCKQLGVGQPLWYPGSGSRLGSYRRSIQLTFEEVRRLVSAARPTTEA